jgi:hypothetical protein
MIGDPHAELHLMSGRHRRALLFPCHLQLPFLLVLVFRVVEQATNWGLSLGDYLYKIQSLRLGLL